MLAQQLAMQQHMMTQGGNTATAGTPTATNGSTATATPNNMMQQNPYAAAMAGGMGGFPMMANMGGAMPIISAGGEA